jgi:hypothetical protein
VVDGDHSHVDVRRVRPHVEIPQSVEAGWGIIEIFVHVPVEHKAEIRTPLV